MIDPGQMRTPLVYQTPKAISDGGGASHEEWTDAFITWARVRPLKGDETIQSGPQLRASLDYEVVCRFDSRITSLGRFRLPGTDRTFAISAVVDWEMRGAELTIRVIENQGVPS